MLRDKLSQFNKDIVKPGETSRDDSEYNRYRVAQKTLGGDIIENPEGTFLKIESNFSKDYRHGNLTINQLSQYDRYRQIHFDNYGSNETMDISNLLFFDIETTGLGGSGTVAFLIGLGSVIDDNFQVRQYFLPDYPDEAAMLEAVRSEINENTIIVSYNGKAFDIPILTDRMIINRVERNLELGGHIDLLHSTRRLYRRRLGSCRLSNIERHILEYERYDDLPGELVPAVYFSWLNNLDRSLLGKVVEHNLYDIVSLYFLMFQISRTHENPAERLEDADDIYSVARIYENRKEFDKVRQTLKTFGTIIEQDHRHDLLFMQSLACKRLGHLAEAEKLWIELAEISHEKRYQAMIELAKYYEHKTRDIALALEFSHKAKEICPPRETDRLDVNKRITRLTNKLSG